jgi:hypothetical protein
MTRIPRFSQRSLHGLGRRIGAAFRRTVQHRFVRDKRVQLIEMNGRRYKRLTLPGASLAEEITANLATFRHSGIFPALVATIDAELVLEFVDGRPFERRLDATLADRLAGFFATLYAMDARRVRTADTAFPDNLQRDLAFLRDVAVLDAAAHRDLAAAADAIAPVWVWVGWDYLDPLPKNFVVTHEGRLVAVDVEDLRRDQLIGSGVAKACLRSIEFPGERLVKAVSRDSGLDLTAVMPFVELHFLAGWTKLAYLKGRSFLVDPAHFEPYRARGVSSVARPDSTR